MPTNRWRDRGQPTISHSKCEMERCMRKWGVNPEKGSHHEEYWTNAVGFVERCCTSNIETPSTYTSIPMVLPKDCQEAVHKVLLQELSNLSQERLIEVEDSLFESEGLWGAPYGYNKVTGRYEVIERFKHVSADDLDPFKRFLSLTRPTEETIREQWSKRVGPSVYQAILLHHVSYSVNCKNCNKGSLIWNAGNRDSSLWKKFMCMNCKSLYEIKTYSNTKHMTKKTSSNMLDNGTFLDAYYHACKELNSSESRGKHYMVIFCMDPVFKHGTGEKVWKAFIAEIDYVLPQLRNKSFDDSKLRVYTRVFLKRNPGITPWIDVPAFAINEQKFAKEALNIHFGSTEKNK